MNPNEMKLEDAFALIQCLQKKSKSKKVVEGGIRIVILQRGWVMVGKYTQHGMDCTLENAYVIRKWGTTQGLPELAIKGKLTDTVLDKSPTIHFHKLTEIASIQCDPCKWSDL